jgi:hypothetical protein
MVTDKELMAARGEKPPEELPAWTQEPATKPQLGFIKGLIESRDIPKPWLLRIKELMEAKGGLKKGDAGNIIKHLKARPLKPGADNRSINKPTIDAVPPGRYAVQTGQDANDITFYHVKENKNKGYRIILKIAGPSEISIKGSEAKDAIKRIIRFGLGDAAVLYGRTIGRCSQCNTRITNRLSRELGIGPICGGRVYGAGWETRVNSARSALQARDLDPAENVEL